MKWYQVHFAPKKLFNLVLSSLPMENFCGPDPQFTHLSNTHSQSRASFACRSTKRIYLTFQIVCICNNSGENQMYHNLRICLGGSEIWDLSTTEHILLPPEPSKSVSASSALFCPGWKLVLLKLVRKLRFHLSQRMTTLERMAIWLCVGGLNTH